MMYKRTVGIIVSLLVVSSLYGISHKKESKQRDQNCTELFIMEKGVKRKVLIPNTSSKYSVSSSTDARVSAKKGVLIMFDDPKNIDIAAFEAKYGLTFVTKMRIGYYLFKNSSKYSDITLIDNILSSEKHVITIKPNWKMNKSVR